MRYSIFQYSQEKLLEYSLDVVDALILSWFSDFFVTGMEKKIFREEGDDTGRLYGWVKLSKVLDDLPCIGIDSENGIRRRFNGFVEKGIMQRKTILTNNGKKTYYRPTEIYDSLINTGIPGSSQKDERKEAEEKSVQANPHRHSDDHAHSHENSYAHRHSDDYALNDSPISDYPITDAATRSQENLSEHEKIKTAAEKIFGENFFDSSFPEKAAAFFSQKLKSSDFEAYFEFIKSRTDAKKAQNPRGLSYRLIFQNDILQEFLNKKEQIKQAELQKEQEKITCPVCSHRHSAGETCPRCGQNYYSLKNLPEKELLKQKRLFAMPEEKRNEYEAELSKIYGVNPMSEILRNQNLKKELDEKIHLLELKYGLAV